MNFLNTLKKNEINFSWNYNVSSKKKILQSLSFIKNKKKLINITEKNTQVFQLLKSIKLISLLIKQHNKLYLILSKSDIADLYETFNSIIKIKNITVISNWVYGQCTNKVSSNSENSVMFFSKKKDNQTAIAINGFKIQKILKELRQSGVPIINFGFDGKNFNTYEINVPINLSSITSLAQFLITLNYLIQVTD